MTTITDPKVYPEGWDYGADEDEGWKDNDWDDEEGYDPEFGHPCNHCGPWCPEWCGDGLCSLEIEQQAAEDQEYHNRFVTKNFTCPVCKQQLTLYSVPAENLWEWPGDFYNPMIALNIYSMCGVPKGELHHSGDIYHIWVGDGKSRDEKLIRLSGGRGNAALDYDRFAHAMGLIAEVFPGLPIKIEEAPPYALTMTLHNASPEAALHAGFQAGLFGITEITTVADDVVIIVHMKMEE